MAKAEKMEVALDRASRDTIRSLVAAIDRLSDAVLAGVDPETLTDDPEHVATLRRLVEDVTKRPDANMPKFAQGGFIPGTGNPDISEARITINGKEYRPSSAGYIRLDD